MKYFLWSFLSADSRWAVVSFWPKNMNKYCLTAEMSPLETIGMKCQSLDFMGKKK